MRKYAKPLIAILAGLATKWALQAGGVEPLYAKLAGLVIVVGLIMLFYRRSAAL